MVVTDGCSLQLLNLQNQVNIVAFNTNENDTDPAPGKPFPKLFKHLSHYGGWPWLAASSTCFTMTKCKANLTPAIHSEAGIAAALAFQACYQGLLAETLRLLVLDPGIALSYICTMSPYGKGRAVYACIMSRLCRGPLCQII